MPFGDLGNDCACRGFVRLAVDHGLLHHDIRYTQQLFWAEHPIHSQLPRQSIPATADIFTTRLTKLVSTAIR